jgi:hypothetical protein
MNLSNVPTSSKELLTNKHLAEAFYPSNGDIFTSKKNAFNVDNAKTIQILKENKKLPLNIFFGDIKINEPKSIHTTNGK